MITRESDEVAIRLNELALSIDVEHTTSSECAAMNAFIRKLENFVPLCAGDKELLADACSNRRFVPAHRELIRAGEKPDGLYIILDGVACRSRVQKDGALGITAYLLPGDISDQHTFILKEMDHTISALSRCTIAIFRQEEFLQLVEDRPRIIRALWWSALVNEAIAREWISNIGIRRAPKRVAHLLCELLIRLESVGLASRNSYTLPITQIELGQALGLSAVHINRVLRSLRERNLVTWRAGGRICIPDVQRLKAFSGFDDNYLHLDRNSKEPRGLAARNTTQFSTGRRLRKFLRSGAIA